MARDFTKNASNRLGWSTNTIGNLINGAAKVSVHLWANIDSTDTAAGNNRLLSTFVNGGSNGLRMSIENTGAPRNLLISGRSGGGDSLQSKTGTTNLSLTTWYSLGGVWDFSGDIITPYVNGSAEGGGSVTFGNSAYTQGSATANDAVGTQDNSGTTTTASSTDGRIAELAIWDVDIGSSAFAALAGGDHPLTVNFSDLVLYLSIYGDNSPEPDYFDKTNATVTGSLPKATHPTMDAPPAQSNPRYLIQGGI